MSFNLKMIGAAALVAGGMGLASAASAAPAAPAADLAGSGLIERVAQGCGPGFARGPGGYCRPMRRGYYGPGPGFRGPGWGPRRCWVRHTPWGPRRVCR
ncbi:GCG_CRPN prefix-to-repeats domain-containing protein [Enterovirga aerilata]|uniref:Sulfur globule protein n=1 Tax=Enterovirga aerilata TaxID=2730920 RepID=A0A849I1S9_9HYPH|nr:hypothetical protein [Enterovirga sp. DB1703]NNM71554.1 hypothetical protein [Enterovirga sp. DB1703]